MKARRADNYAQRVDDPLEQHHHLSLVFDRHPWRPHGSLARAAIVTHRVDQIRGARFRHTRCRKPGMEYELSAR
jgi:hypothetical protein